ncbi:hypothetical protein GOBAR_DD07598 [Gossypium barbadense]|nr:hypothetical protein GOBAR_DD07598 [Gossypium barbadense]
MEEVLTGLQITDEEEEAWQLYRDSSLQQLDYDLCLVEFFLTASVVHFLAIRGVLISDRGEKRFLFRKENPGGDLQQAFWGVCKSYIATDFEYHIKKINLSNIVPIKIPRRPKKNRVKKEGERGVGVNYLEEGVPQSTPPPALFDLAPLALSQTVASETSASSPAPSTQLTPPTIAAFSA